MGPVIIVHGGACSIPLEKIEAKVNGVKRAVLAGSQVLETGGSALNAIETAINILENDENFNAGFGSVLNIDGEVEMDASIMDGSNLKAGSVALVKEVQNPISLARCVMDNTPHVMICAHGTSKFAKEQGIPLVPPESLISDFARSYLEEFIKNRSLPEDIGKMGGTVGAVALDINGHLAAATSTGGVNGKMVGRVGDTPQIGSGTYADDKIGAVSCTGHGEIIIRYCLAHSIIKEMEKGVSAVDATTLHVAQMSDELQNKAGAISISNKGDVGFYFTSVQMPWAYKQDGVLHFGVEPGQHETETKTTCSLGQVVLPTEAGETVIQADDSIQKDQKCGCSKTKIRKCEIQPAPDECIKIESIKEETVENVDEAAERRASEKAESDIFQVEDIPAPVENESVPAEEEAAPAEDEIRSVLAEEVSIPAEEPTTISEEETTLTPAEEEAASASAEEEATSAPAEEEAASASAEEQAASALAVEEAASSPAEEEAASAHAEEEAASASAEEEAASAPAEEETRPGSVIASTGSCVQNIAPRSCEGKLASVDKTAESLVIEEAETVPEDVVETPTEEEPEAAAVAAEASIAEDESPEAEEAEPPIEEAEATGTFEEIETAETTEPTVPVEDSEVASPTEGEEITAAETTEIIQDPGEAKRLKKKRGKCNCAEIREKRARRYLEETMAKARLSDEPIKSEEVDKPEPEVEDKTMESQEGPQELSGAPEDLIKSETEPDEETPEDINESEEPEEANVETAVEDSEQKVSEEISETPKDVDSIPVESEIVEPLELKNICGTKVITTNRVSDFNEENFDETIIDINKEICGSKATVMTHISKICDSKLEVVDIPNELRFSKTTVSEVSKQDTPEEVTDASLPEETLPEETLSAEPQDTNDAVDEVITATGSTKAQEITEDTVEKQRKEPEEITDVSEEPLESSEDRPDTTELDDTAEEFEDLPEDEVAAQIDVQLSQEKQDSKKSCICSKSKRK